jgi:hypothetical protein
MRNKIANETIQQAMATDAGALSKVAIREMSMDVMINNKKSLRDVSYIFDSLIGKPIKDNNITIPGASGVQVGDVVTAQMRTADGSMTNVLLRATTRKGQSVKLDLVPESLLRDKTMPKNKMPVRDEKTRGTMYMMVEDSMSSVEQDKSIGKTRDGQDIIDNDGKYGSTERFMLVEEENHFEENNEPLDFLDYVRLKFNGVDANKLDRL